MGRRVALAILLVFVFQAAAPAAEARSHEEFSASTYYDAEDKLVVEPESSTTTVDPNDRYPNGYPNQGHHYNSVSGTYDDQEQTKTSTTTVPGTFPRRYEAGYTNANGRTFQQYSSTSQVGNQVDEFTFDPVAGRYKAGYHPHSAYAGAVQKTTTAVKASDVISLSAQSSNEQTYGNDFAHRYERGYYPQSSYTQTDYSTNQQQSLAQSQSKPVSFSTYSGQFSTMPYPSSGVPFVASGAGCRTSYWVENVHMWPSFFTVKSTVADAFGAEASKTFGDTTLLQGLLKYGSDPYNDLLRTGTTSLLNSYTRGAFSISHMKVIERFNAALVSKEAAKAQALEFETENVESISAGSACT